MTIIEVGNNVFFSTIINGTNQILLKIDRLPSSESVENFKKLKHTKSTVNYLFRLMLAYFSQRTILIEG